MTYPTEDTTMTVQEIVERHIYLLKKADIRLPDSTRAKYRLPDGKWVIRRWDSPRISGADRRSVISIRAFVSLVGTETVWPIRLNPEEMLLVKALPTNKGD